MSDITLCQVSVPRTDGITLSWVGTQSHELFRADNLATSGHDDFLMSMSQRIHGLRETEEFWFVALAAVRGIDGAALPEGPNGLPLLSWDVEEAPPAGEVVACASVSAGLKDNQHLANAYVMVREDARRAGIGRRVHAELERIAREHGCRTLQGWATHAGPQPGAEALVPPTGFGAVALDDPAACFATALGYDLEQCERRSMLSLPVDEAVLAPLEADATAASSDYEIRSFHDCPPDDVIDSYAALMRHFSTEIPTAGLDVEEEAIDAERLRGLSQRRVERGTRTWNTIAVDPSTGAVVAQTDITIDEHRPAAGFQQSTIVHRDHRGHRLGMRVKIANLRFLAADGAPAQRIHTWNAGENAHMLAINEALGFTASAVEGAWQKRLA